jgi:hypothetical protein
MKLNNQNQTKLSGIHTASGLKAGWYCNNCVETHGFAYGWDCTDGKQHTCGTFGGHKAACYPWHRYGQSGSSPDGGACT